MIGKDVKVAQNYLKNGDLVAMPTETVYGLAGNTFDDKAVLKIFETKNRPSFDPLIVHTFAVSEILTFADLNEKAAILFQTFAPGPLTILLNKKEIVSDLVTSGLPRVAVRIPKHPVALDLLRGLPFPLAAPSANPFGYISPTTAQHVAAQLDDKIPYILDGGACQIGVESTIIGFENDDETVVYRLGGLSLEDLENAVGKVRVQLNQSSNPHAPGMLKSHYAPRKPLFLGNIEDFLTKKGWKLTTHNSKLLNTEGGLLDKKIGILSFQKDFSTHPAVVRQIRLSPAGNTYEAAQHLFAALRELDASEVDLILAETVPPVGLGLAVNDRLKRAAAVD
jgi:L-threonylcarbamoyladenylate synthase